MTLDQIPSGDACPISVLVIDDDIAFCDHILPVLQEAGYTARAVHDAGSARATLKDDPVDLVLLDLVLPGTSGKVLCRELAETSNAGIIVVSVLEADDERIALLEMGADDFLVKPFNPRELLARMRAFLRRKENRAVPSAWELGPWKLDPSGRRLKNSDGKIVTLTPSEARVMRMFADNPELVFDRGEILAISRMRQIGGGEDRSVDNLIKRLRRKVEADPANPMLIETVWGRGYMLRAS